MPAVTAPRIGSYEIVSTLGAGGMGEVFRAWDYRLQRDVAIKVVKGSTSDPEWQQRFLQEARAAGGLNHPNILTIHDVGVEEGVPYLVTELVDGESLQSLIKSRALPLDRALDLAVQILDGLVAAHQAGIVHRDLKPANIMITKAGRVKLLDFGLAKQVSRAADSAPRDLTEPGLIIGTATYMSPEQARGEPVDVRSDQFSFGLILYEMLAGTPAFDRGSAVRTMAAIIDEECRPVSALNPSVPAPLVWIVDRCLAKDRDNRYASTFDLFFDLKAVRDRAKDLVSSQPAPTAKRHSRIPLCIAVALCAVLTGLLGRALWLSRETVDFNQYRLLPLASSGVFEGEPAWSPDGKNIAYTGDVGRVRQIFVRNLSAFAAAQITRGLQDCTQPFWSADGTRVLYISAEQSGVPALWSVGATGGAPRRLRSNVVAASISQDGKLAYLQPEQGEGISLWVAPSAQSPDAKRYGQGDWLKRSFSRGYLAFSPDGKSIGLWLATWTGKSEFWLLPFPSGEPRRAFTFEDGIYPFHWMPDNRRILFGGAVPGAIGSDLHIADLQTGRFIPISRTTRDALQPALSPDTKHIAFTIAEHDFDVWHASVANPDLQPLISSSRNEYSPAWSPVGNQLAFVSDRTGRVQIWVKTFPDGWARPLVSAKDLNRGWVSSFDDLSYSADGQRLAFTATRAGTHSIYVFNSAGGPLVKLTTDDAEERSPSWSPDGNTVAFADNTKNGSWLATASSGGDGSPTLVRKFASVHNVRWSPRGDLIACNTRDTLFLVSPDGTVAKAASTAQWLTFDWLDNGTKLIGVVRQADGSRVLASLDVASGAVAELAQMDLPSVAEIGRISVARQRGEIALAASRPRGDIWTVEGFPGSRSVASALSNLFMLPSSK